MDNRTDITNLSDDAPPWYKIILFLGHGRALESYLVSLKYALAIDIATQSRVDQRIAVFWDLSWWVPDAILAVPFAIVASLQLIGLVLNYQGHEGSCVPRAIGAGLGITLWMWIIIKSLLIGEIHTGIFPMAITSVPFSTWLLWKAINKLPVPGSKSFS